MILEVFPCANEFMQRCDGGDYHSHEPKRNCPAPEPVPTPTYNPPTEPPPPCTPDWCCDDNSSCEGWANAGECETRASEYVFVF